MIAWDRRWLKFEQITIAAYVSAQLMLVLEIETDKLDESLNKRLGEKV